MKGTLGKMGGYMFKLSPKFIRDLSKNKGTLQHHQSTHVKEIKTLQDIKWGMGCQGHHFFVNLTYASHNSSLTI